MESLNGAGSAQQTVTKGGTLRDRLSYRYNPHIRGLVFVTHKIFLNEVHVWKKLLAGIVFYNF